MKIIVTSLFPDAVAAYFANLSSLIAVDNVDTAESVASVFASK